MLFVFVLLYQELAVYDINYIYITVNIKHSKVVFTTDIIRLHRKNQEYEKVTGRMPYVNGSSPRVLLPERGNIFLDEA